MIYAKVVSILGKVRGMGGLTQVELQYEGGKYPIVRNFIGRINVGQTIALLDTVREDRILTKRSNLPKK